MTKLFDRQGKLRRWLRGAVSALATLSTVVVLSGVSASPASAANYGPANHFRLGFYGNYCLDAALETIGNGGRVQLWACTGSIQQRWYFKDNLIRSALDPSLCLDAKTQTIGNGGTVQLWTCNGGYQQKWYQDNNYQLSISGNWNLDAAAETIGNGGRIQLWSYSYRSKTQRWFFEFP